MILPGEGIQVECRELPVTGNDDGKTLQQITGKVSTLGIDPQHAVGHVNGRKGRDKQMTDFPI